jgi:hypothetical protein
MRNMKFNSASVYRLALIYVLLNDAVSSRLYSVLLCIWIHKYVELICIHNHSKPDILALNTE